MVRIKLSLFKRKDCPEWAKYVFSSHGKLCFSEIHPDLIFVQGIGIDWMKPKFGKYLETKEKVCSDYIERLVLCRNGNDFKTHKEELKNMKKIDGMFKNVP